LPFPHEALKNEKELVKKQERYNFKKKVLEEV
jgi:hypothetical protein